MKETIAPVMSVVANGTSVTHSYSPRLYKAARTLSLFSSRIVRLFRHTKSPYSYDRATIGLSGIGVTLHSSKPRAACTALPCCYAIPGVSST